MADFIDMSLDDIIKKKKGPRRHSSGGAVGRSGSGRGAVVGKRRGSSGSGSRRGLIVGRNGVRRSLGGGGPDRKKSPFGGKRRSLDTGRRVSDGGPRRGGIAAESGPGKLVVSNLDYGVSDSDIVELFSEFGRLRSSSVHYDKSGRSLGSADIVFDRRIDAVKAMKQYNGVPLDGKKMKIMVATSDVEAIAPNAFIPKNRSGRIDKSPRAARRRSGGTVPTRGGGTPMGKAGRIKVKKEPTPTKEELDKELDSYYNTSF